MMRDIRFRAWDTKDKTIRDVVGMSLYHETLSVDIEFGKYLQDDARRFELMQYTRLKDKNGTEIYEGDIIWDAHAEIHGKVTFDEGTFCVEWATHIEHLFEVLSDYYAEVIGNIYENPELLGDSQ